MYTSLQIWYNEGEDYNEMRIWTSRYANKKLNNKEHYCVGISLGKPKFKLPYEIEEQCFMLAPRRDMWNKSRDEFCDAYRAMLDKYGEQKVTRCIMHMVGAAEGRDVALLCFEDVRDEEQYCHRTVLADWLNEHGFGDIEELDDPTPVRVKKKEEPDAQMRMAIE